MEEIVYLSIRLGCTAYLLYKVWEQKKRIGEICDLLYTPRSKKPEMEKDDHRNPENTTDVMGATRFVYLDENAGKTVAPYMSQQLEMGSDLIGKDEDIPEDEVECDLPLLNVGDVLLNLDGGGSDENKSRRAAMTLRAIRETDMFELFSSQVENKRLIEELMERYIDEEGNIKQKKGMIEMLVDWKQLI